jgi:DNA-binding PadR family transcriptional regulator
VSLRSTIVATLLLGDQYGLQLHGEVVSRTARPSPLNVGQVYATLDRLISAGQVAESGTTPDGLRQYCLTAEGRRSAEAWLTTPVSPRDWGSMREQVLLVSTVPGAEIGPLLRSYRLMWAEPSPSPSELADLGAEAALCQAALDWLDSLGDLRGRQRPLGEVRPRRGRRPVA